MIASMADLPNSGVGLLACPGERNSPNPFSCRIVTGNSTCIITTIFLLAMTAHAQTAAPWPEADCIFRSDPRWLGADAAFSVDLGQGRVLWLFGDSFVASH